MKCPHCPDTTLVMSERHGIEIDYCPACRGIWLDRGELDKLLDKAALPASETPGLIPHVPRQRDFADSDFNNYPRKRHYRQKSWLHELFD